MADGGDTDKESKTEEASPRRLEKLREEGRAVRSQEVNSAVSLVVGMLVFALLAAQTADQVARFTHRILRLQDVGRMGSAMQSGLEVFAMSALPVALATGVAGVVAGLGQTRGLVTWKELAPKWDRLDPIKGFQRVLPTMDVMVELGKTLLKVAVIALIAWRTLRHAFVNFGLLARTAPVVAAAEVRSVVGQLSLEIAIALTVVAALDFGRAYQKFHKDARMSKQELKDEHKEQEGDPALKAKRRARARQVVRQRTIAEVRTATVLVTNPTHLAVALRYRAGTDLAPIVVAKGQDELAMRMREEARRFGVPIVENRPLARAMHKQAKVGKPIPVELYETVAHVIAHVMRIRGALR